MKLNVKNPGAGMLHKSLGIEEERANELSDKLDDVMKKGEEEHDAGKEVSLSELLGRIAEICDTLEEYTFCMFNHFNYCIVNDYYSINGHPVVMLEGSIEEEPIEEKEHEKG